MAERKYTPVAPLGKCSTCGSIFHQKISRGCARRYCSDGCNPPKPVVTKKCDIAECWNLARTNGTPYCETHYYRVRRTGLIGLPIPRVVHPSCHYCGAPSNGNKFCGQRCDARWRRGIPRYKSCLTCGSEFEPLNDGIDKKCCSDECQRIRKQDAMDSRRCLSSLNLEGRSIRYEVFKRDNWTCKICNKPVDRNSKWPDPEYPTLDHIYPFSKGGGHELGNLQCAHAQCNIRKHAKTVKENGGFGNELR